MNMRHCTKVYSRNVPAKALSKYFTNTVDRKTNLQEERLCIQVEHEEGKKAMLRP